MARRNKMRSLSSSRRKGGFLKKFALTLFFLIIVGAIFGGYILFETKPPILTIEKEITYLGSNVELPITVTDMQSGISSIEVSLKQKDKTCELFNRSFERKSWFTKAGPETVKETLTIKAEKAQFDEGEAQLIIRARDFSLLGMFKGNETIKNVPVLIDTKPPKVSITHSVRYLQPGHTGIVKYTLSEPVEKHGVQIDSTFYQGFPVKEGSKQYVSFIALPWNSAKPNRTQVIAVDQSGNVGKASFRFNYRPLKKKQDRINVSQGFLDNKAQEVQEHYPSLKGEMLEKYLYLNKTMRIENNKKIKELCSHPEPNRMWEGRFTRMPGARKAGFADQRTYYFHNKVIDHQTHLGIDLASVARAEVRAANGGKVIFADYLGIYGNMIIIDHGQGIYSLYSHLSSINCTAGDQVDKEQPIGNTGTSGLAGGDHLHLSILVHGVFVTPLEWWDKNWLKANIESYLNN